MSRAVQLSILIVSFNTRELIRRCLESIRRFPPPVPYETLVVDNGSTDGSPDLVEEQFPDVRVIRNNANVGFAAANNRALQVAGGEFILFLNSDTELIAESLVPVLDRLAKEPRVGIAGPVEQLKDGTAYPTTCPFPNLWSLFLIHAGLRRRFYASGWLNPSRRLWEEACRSGRPVAVDWLSGATLMVRRRVLDQIGLFDEGYFFYMEETDLCRRAKDAGWQIELVPDARLIHHDGGSAGQVRSGLLSLSAALSEIRYFRKHRPLVERLLLRILLAVESVLKMIGARRPDPRRWAYRQTLLAALGLRPLRISLDDRPGARPAGG